MMLKTILRIVGVFLFVSWSVSARPLFSEELRIRIGAFVDGKSQLRVSGTSLYWFHQEFAAPGRLRGTNDPTVINGVDWFPAWPDVPNSENRFCECASDVYDWVSPELPRDSDLVFVDVVEGRGSVSIEVPSEENEDEWRVTINDPEGGTDWYVIEFTLRQRFQRGYVNADGALEISDAISVLLHLFSSNVSIAFRASEPLMSTTTQWSMSAMRSVS